MAITDIFFNTTWREKLHPASFRNVPFYVFGTETSVGRRNVLHQYPFKDEPYVEDFGKDAEEYIINGYVLANKNNSYDYFEQRNKLIAALRAKGSGTLIHPYLGKLTVAVQGKCKISETIEEGGIARFTMTFVNAGKKKSLSKINDWIELVDSYATDAEGNIQDSIGSKWETIGSIVDATTTLRNIANTFFNTQKKVMRAMKGGLRSSISLALSYVDDNLALLTDTIMENGCSIASLVMGSINGFKNLGGIYGDFLDNIHTGLCSGNITERKTGIKTEATKKEGMLSYKYGKSLLDNTLSMLEFGKESSSEANLCGAGENNFLTYNTIITTIPAGTGFSLDLSTQINSVNSAKVAKNAIHLINFIRDMSLITATQIAVRLEFSSQDEALRVMNEVNYALDEQIMKLGDEAASTDFLPYNLTIEDDESYEAMKELRRVFTESMMGLAADLPQLINYEVSPGVLPALVMAYNQYDDIDRESEIITMNQSTIPHPGFLPNGDSIQLLSY